MSNDRVAFSPVRALHGQARVPGDKSISHRALIFAGLAEGTSEVRGLSDGDDVQRTARAMAAYGVNIEATSITGGRDRLREPERPLDVGNSGTSFRLLAGVAASLPFLSVLVGDTSIHRRPMARIVTPLVEMGARVDGRADATLAPLCIRGGGLVGIDYTPEVPSAQVKGCVLLAGLGATGTTTVREAIATRMHTEEFLELTGSPATITREGQAAVVSLTPRPLSPFHLDVPGDPSQAAFLVVAASIVVGSEIVVEHVYVGEERVGFLGVLQRMGAAIEVMNRHGDIGDLHVRYAPLQATTIEGVEVPSLIDEIPALAVAAAFAEGVTTFRDAGELRAKESDRIETIAAGLRSLGCVVETAPDGLAIHGGAARLREARIDAAGDHRIAMAFALAGLAGKGVVIEGFSAVATSWPGFEGALEALSWP